MELSISNNQEEFPSVATLLISNNTNELSPISDIENSIISLRLRQIKIRLMLNDKEMSNKLNINAGQLGKYLRGEQTPSCTLLFKIKEVFNIDMNWFCNSHNEDKIQFNIKVKD